MEEKERYEVISNKKNFIEIQDTESNADTFITEDNIEDLLNKQDKENQQLKQQLNESEKENKALKDIRTLERVIPKNTQLNKLSNRDCYLKGFDNAISETIRVFEETYGKDKTELIEERNEYLSDIVKVGGYRHQIKELKQQLHDLPKKIIAEIEKSFTEYLPLKYKTGAGFYAKLNTILKKYGGENERK